ncbi:efflux RND transporter periplasmic adaptor subunit [Defluviimonas salinarum]|uniref:Efflux RND transporter periplasmic adaptor subunit n=1 Tax=Defluviimonas salinarum TaxID=2992147 RepID=A0ABT3IYX8_9RHOB|nr:efflux RND transporter periplasmic adaptor subunit [Defluviimonas salinarum]MCW3780415.1 efflux RND transporter periplasmic adaptor subunit [Defluviimonas salinarum]
MKAARNVLLASVLAGATGWAGITAGQQAAPAASTPHAHSGAEAAGGLDGQDAMAMPVAAGTAASDTRRILYYRNPMGLPDTSPVPKKDPMGMDYIPVYEGEVDDAGTIRVSPGKLQRTGVRTTQAIRGPLAMTVRAPGIVRLDERRLTVVALRADAFLETVADVTTGATVRRGTPLAMLYSPEVTAAAALFVSDLRDGGGRAEGSRRRLENLGVPVGQIDAIAADRRAQVSIALTAPRSGVVLERLAVEGMMAKAGEPLFRIADTSQVWVMADVPEAALSGVARGAEALVSLRGLPGEALTARVSEIYPEVDLQTRTARVRIDLPNPDGRFLINMYAEVEIAAGDRAAVVQVPDSAVIDTGDRQVVIRDMGEGRFAAQEVVPGRRGNGMVEIRDGLAEGTRVVTTATFLLDADSNLNAALAALSGAEAGQ